MTCTSKLGKRPCDHESDGHPMDNDQAESDDLAATPIGSRRDRTGGARGNERLTAMTGALLLVLFAAECLTILSIRHLLTLHYFLGMLLIGPVLLKVCSTVYRFTRYYMGAIPYRRRGPPALLLRILGPFVILTSLAVLGSGVVLGLTTPDEKLWLTLHTVAFALWFAAITLHVNAYLAQLPRILWSDLADRLRGRAAQVLAGRAARWLLLVASVGAGLVLALLTYHRAGVWLNTHPPGPSKPGEG